MKKVVKLIMELIFIFILPLLFILLSIDVKKEDVYNTDNLLESETKTFEYNNQLLIDIDSPQYINFLDLNQLLHNNLSPFTNTDYWIQSTVGSATISNGNLIFTLPQSNYIIQNFNVSLNHKYYINMIYFNYYTNGKIIIQIGGNDINVSLNTYQSSFENIYTATANTTGYFGLYNDNVSESKTAISSVMIIDLTKMYGVGYEPTLTEIQSNDIFNTFYSYTESEIITYKDNSIISENYKINYTPFGSLKKLALDQFHLNDNFIIKVLFDYTVIWFVMFLLWHLFYGLFDGLIHMLSFDRKRE